MLPTPPSTSHSIGAGRIPIKSIVWNDRMRQDTPVVRKHIQDLAMSISEKGLIQPPVIQFKNDIPHGIAGWCRTQAQILLGNEDTSYVLRENLPPDLALELELDENLHRLDMTWQENTIGIYRIHEAKASSSSKRDEKWGVRETGKLLGVASGHVAECVQVAKLLIKGHASIQTCTSLKDAHKVLLKEKEDELVKRLASLNSGLSHISTAPKLSTTTSGPIGSALDLGINLMPTRSGNEPLQNPISAIGKAETMEVRLSDMLLFKSCHDWFAEAQAECMDIIYTDIPYGIDMVNLDDIEDADMVKEVHHVDENVEQFEKFLKGSYKVLKDNSYLLFFYDLCHHEKIMDFGRSVGFNVQPFPVLWIKPTAKNRAAHCHWPKCHETVAVMRKGKASLRMPMTTNYFMCDGRAERKLQRHPFSKPFAFSKWLLDPVVVPGMRALDPYAGGGSIVRAMLNLGLKPLGIENEETLYPHLLENIKQTVIDMSAGKQVRFV